MTEAQLSTRLQKYCPGAHWVRIENLVGVGVPDLYCCYRGKSFWFELKIQGQAAIRPSQLAWHVRHKSHGGKAFILKYWPTNNILIVYTVGGIDWEQETAFKFNLTNWALFLASL